MKRIELIILAVILCIGIFFRFYQLGSIPNSLNWDEVSWGYNAYSIATTGKDEYGSFLPLSFKAFGDYKQPVYVYLDVIPVIIGGLSAFAVRFPSALCGSLTILSVFFLIRELFYKDQRKNVLALLVAGLFAVSPWSIQFSRVAFEANVGIFFLITGVACFISGLRQKKISLMVLGSIILSVSCYTYHSQKVFTPLLFIGLLFYAGQYLLEKKSRILILLITFLVVNSIWILDARTTARGRSVMFTSQQTQILAEPTKKLISDREQHNVLGQIVHNRRVVYAQKYIQNYLLHFDPNYLFVKGDNPRHHPPGMGILYLVSFPFIVIGMISLWKKYRKVSLFIFFWLLLAPAASSLAVDAPNASRSMVFLPIWQLFAGMGIMSFFQHFQKKIKPYVIIFMIGFLYLINISYYTHWYFGHTDTEYASYWQYGYREAVHYSQDHAGDHHEFFTSSLEQPYIFYLFYHKISPAAYISSGGSNRINKPCFMINSAYFGKCDQKEQTGDYIYSLYNESTNPHLVKAEEILYPNHEPSVYIYRYR